MADDHYHVWSVAGGSRTGAFLSKAFASRTAANRWARRQAGGDSQWYFVVKCRFEGDCPRPPKPSLAKNPGDSE